MTTGFRTENDLEKVWWIKQNNEVSRTVSIDNVKSGGMPLVFNTYHPLDLAWKSENIRLGNALNC